MVNVALFVRLEAKPGKEVEVEAFLREGLPLVQDQPATIAWFGIGLGPSTFGIFDAFLDESGRQAHLSGKVAVRSERQEINRLFFVSRCSMSCRSAPTPSPSSTRKPIS